MCLNSFDLFIVILNTSTSLKIIHQMNEKLNCFCYVLKMKIGLKKNIFPRSI